MAQPIRAPEVEVSPVPRAPKNTGDAKHKAPAAVLFRAMRERGAAGLSWRECWMVLEEGAFEDAQVGPTIIWMRSKGVGVIALYENGETIFVLEEVGAKERESLAVTEGSD